MLFTLSSTSVWNDSGVSRRHVVLQPPWTFYLYSLSHFINANFLFVVAFNILLSRFFSNGDWVVRRLGDGVIV